MKIFLSILCVILMACLGAVGFFWYKENSTKNSPGSMFKDKDLSTCTPFDKEVFKGRVSEHLKALEESIANGSAPGVSLGTEEDIRAFLSSEAQETYDGSVEYCTRETDMILAAYEPLVDIVMSSLEETKRKARIASAKASIASTAPAVIICVEDGGFVTEPESQKQVCEPDTGFGVWPDISNYNARWGGCEVQVDRENGTFEYCATIEEGLVTCTHTGCKFPE